MRKYCGELRLNSHYLGLACSSVSLCVYLSPKEVFVNPDHSSRGIGIQEIDLAKLLGNWGK